MKKENIIILPGLPHLEWMTENLTGFGGTEVNGRWYYTYEEAEEAVKQLGNGWRLATPEEWQAVADLGSEWQEDGPHGLPGRLFGGGLFLDAAGCRIRDTGALAVVGERGHVWSSSSAYAGSVYTGCLYFNSTSVRPLDFTWRAHGMPVRCVRNVLRASGSKMNESDSFSGRFEAFPATKDTTMKSERASACLEKCAIQSSDPYIGRYVRYDEAAICIDIAEQEAEKRVRAELTRWHDPKKELPDDFMPVEVKYDNCGRICYAIAYLKEIADLNVKVWAVDWTTHILDPYKVLGWREIHE